MPLLRASRLSLTLVRLRKCGIPLRAPCCIPDLLKVFQYLEASLKAQTRPRDYGSVRLD